MNTPASVSPDHNITHEANDLVFGDRNNSYGHPRHDFRRQAALWSQVLGIAVTSHQVALCMCLTKIAREVNSPKRDNLVDLAGYALCYTRLSDPVEGDNETQTAATPAVATTPTTSVSRTRFTFWVLTLTALCCALSVIVYRSDMKTRAQAKQIEQMWEVLRVQDDAIRETLKKQQQQQQQSRPRAGRGMVAEVGR